MEDTIQVIAVVIGIVAVILGIVYGIYDYNTSWWIGQRQLATTCIADGGSWIPIYGQGMCLRGTITSKSK